MVLKVCVALLLILVSPILSQPPGSQCPKPSGESSSCVCQTPKGIIDLRSASSNNGVARYKGMEDSNNFVYEYNPCFPFSTVGDCNNVHMCQESKDIPPNTYKIADANTEQMYLDTSGAEPQVTVYYTSYDQFGTSREVNVHLVCDSTVKEPQVSTTGDSIEIYTYEVTFKSCHACPGGCGGGAGGGGGSAAGIAGLVIIILLIAGVATYFVVGSIINAVHFKKSGVEMIPQKVFWFALPGLIKEGCIFTFKPIYDFIQSKRGGGGGGGYKQEL